LELPDELTAAPKAPVPPPAPTPPPPPPPPPSAPPEPTDADGAESPESAEEQPDGEPEDDFPKGPLTPAEARAVFLEIGGRVSYDSTTRLLKVFLNRSQVTDRHLSLLKYLPDTHVLNLSGTAITDAGLLHLHELSSLQRIYLPRTQVTDAGLDQLEKALPDAEIFH
jgi:hypothetical protein